MRRNDSVNNEDIESPWRGAKKSWEHPWHAMCSYLASFPPALARTFISMLSNKNDIIFDPFSGRGTTLIEARLLGRKPLASDLNPLSVALTKAKNTSVELKIILERINELEENFDLVLYTPEANVQEDDIKLIYHPRTLAKLCYLRRELLESDSSVDNFLIGVVLGMMHGAERKDGSSFYASIDMPNTFSMSPNYVKKYVQQNRLKRVDRNIFQVLRERAKHLYRQEANFNINGIVKSIDAKYLSNDNMLKEYKNKVGLVLTSPPYLNIVNYALQNWIRMWFLGKNPKKVNEKLDDNLGLGESLDFLNSVLIELKKMISEDGVIIFVIGDVAKSKNNVISPARDLLRKIYHTNLFEYVGCYSDFLNVDGKMTRIWKDTKGKATAVDRILILSNETPRFNIDELMVQPFINTDNVKLLKKKYKGMFNAEKLAEDAANFARLENRAIVNT